MKALIVDDQPNVRLLLSSILRQKAGCTVIEATNGIEALDVLAREPFDFVVLDVLMPMMDGLETLEAIRRAPPLRHLPVIVLSAVRDEAKVRQLVGHGVTAYLAKPLRPLEVAARIQEIIPRLAPANAPPTRRLPGTDVSRADLRPHMIRATEQVFGMMLGLDVLAIGTDRRAVPGDDVVRVALRLAREDVDLEFTITAPRAMTERMTAQYLQAADVVGDADVSHTLRKVAAIIGSRLQTTLRQRGAEVTLGEPAVSRLGRDGEADPGAMHVCFASRAEELCFTTTLRAVPAAPLAAAARPPLPAARTVTMDTPMPPAVDPEVLEMLASLQEPGEPDLVVELVSLFLRDTPERLRDLDARPLDGARTVRVAHAVKGSAGNLGAMHLQDLAGRLEQAVHLGRPSDELAVLADAVNVEYARVARHLEGVVAGRAGSDSAPQEL